MGWIMSFIPFLNLHYQGPSVFHRMKPRARFLVISLHLHTLTHSHIHTRTHSDRERLVETPSERPRLSWNAYLTAEETMAVVLDTTQSNSAEETMAVVLDTTQSNRVLKRLLETKPCNHLGL